MSVTGFSSPVTPGRTEVLKVGQVMVGGRSPGIINIQTAGPASLPHQPRR